MLKGISYWSIEGGLAGTRSPEEAMREAKAAGFDAIELAISTSGALNTQSDQKTCEAVRAAAENVGIGAKTVAAGLSWGCSPTDANPETRKKSIGLHAAALQRVAWLGA